MPSSGSDPYCCCHASVAAAICVCCALRLLKQDVTAAKAVIVGEPEALAFFSDDLPQEAQQQIFEEFNTLSVVYQQPASLFVQSAQYHIHHAEDFGSADTAAADAAGIVGAAGTEVAAEALLVDESTNLLDSQQQQEADLLDLGDEGPSSSAASARGAPSSAGGSAVGSGGGAMLLDDLGGLDSLLGPSTGANGAMRVQQSQQPQLQLSAAFKLMPGVFQEKWRALSPSEQYVDSLNMASVAALAQNNHKDFCAHMGQANILTMACGGAPPMYK